jgi:hypothetical protein
MVAKTFTAQAVPNQLSMPVVEQLSHAGHIFTSQKNGSEQEVKSCAYNLKDMITNETGATSL